MKSCCKKTLETFVKDVNKKVKKNDEWIAIKRQDWILIQNDYELIDH